MGRKKKIVKDCVHCGGPRLGDRARTLLCKKCLALPSVRNYYLKTKIEGYGAGRMESRGDPPEPTIAQPGSEAKIIILSKRAKRGYNLFHPLDNKERRQLDGKKEDNEERKTNKS